MFSVFRDLIRYNIEFAIGLVLYRHRRRSSRCLSFFSPVDPTAHLRRRRPTSRPSWQYWFGTNSRGQDMFWQLSFAVPQHADLRHHRRDSQPHHLDRRRPRLRLHRRLGRPRADVHQRHLRRGPDLPDPHPVLLRAARPAELVHPGADHGVLRLALRRAPDPLGGARPAAPRVHPAGGVRRHVAAQDHAARSICPT